MKSGLGSKISIIVFRAWLGAVTLFFGGGLLLVWFKVALFSFTAWIFISLSIGAILGGLIGYLIYKKKVKSPEAKG